MPHVVIKGSPDLRAFFEGYKALMEREGEQVLKTERAFIDQASEAVVIEARAIEDGKPQPFLAIVATREDGVVVRLHPLSTDIEKTEGVQRILASIADQLLASDPSLSVGETNLGQFLQKASAS